MMAILCSMLGHRPDRGIARHDGEDYWTTCKRCGSPLIRGDAWRLPTAEEVAHHEAMIENKGGLVDAAGLARSR